MEAIAIHAHKTPAVLPPSTRNGESTSSSRSRSSLITDKIWKNVLPKLTPHLTTRRAERAIVTLRNRRVAHRNQLWTFYTTYLASLPVPSRSIFPQTFVLLSLSSFKALWEPDDSTTVTQESWDAALHSGDVEQYQLQVKKPFSYSTLEAHLGTKEPVAPPANADEPTKSEIDDALARSTSVFCCCHKETHVDAANDASCVGLGLADSIMDYEVRVDGEATFIGVARLYYPPENWVKVGRHMTIEKRFVELAMEVFDGADAEERDGKRFSCGLGLCRYPSSLVTGRDFHSSVTHIRDKHIQQAQPYVQQRGKPASSVEAKDDMATSTEPCLRVVPALAAAGGAHA